MTIRQVHFLISFIGTKSELEALTGIQEGASVAYATDTDQFGTFDGSNWQWGTLNAVDGGSASVPIIPIQIRRDTAANWTASNPTLELGEIGLETDTVYLKVGNGVDDWNSLAYDFQLYTIACGSAADPDTIFEMRTGNTANWTAANPTLTGGEMGYDSESKRFKIGDATTAWNNLVGYGRCEFSTSDPTINDDIDAGYREGDLWINETVGAIKLFVCADNTSGAAVWTRYAKASEIDYALVSGNDGSTDITAAELEDLSDGGATTLHTHAYLPSDADYSDISTNDVNTDVTGAELEDLTDGTVVDSLHGHSFLLPFGTFSSIGPFTTTSFPYVASVDRDITLVRWAQSFHVTSANNGNDANNYWTIDLYDGSSNLLVSLNTTGASVDVWAQKNTTSFSDSAVASGDIIFMRVIKSGATGNPGNLYVAGPGLKVTG